MLHPRAAKMHMSHFSKSYLKCVSIHVNVEDAKLTGKFFSKNKQGENYVCSILDTLHMKMSYLCDKGMKTYFCPQQIYNPINLVTAALHLS